MLQQILQNQEQLLLMMERLTASSHRFPQHFPFPPLPPFEQPFLPPFTPTFPGPRPKPVHLPTTAVHTPTPACYPTPEQLSTPAAQPIASTTGPLLDTAPHHVPAPTAPSAPQQLLPFDRVVKKYPKLRGDKKMGKLAVTLARECFFGVEVMATSSVGGKGPGTTPLPNQGIQEIRRVIFSLCPAYHNNEAKFEETIWRKCKTALNHACLKCRFKKPQ